MSLAYKRDIAHTLEPILETWFHKSCIMTLEFTDDMLREMLKDEL